MSIPTVSVWFTLVESVTLLLRARPSTTCPVSLMTLHAVLLTQSQSGCNSPYPHFLTVCETLLASFHVPHSSGCSAPHSALTHKSGCSNTHFLPHFIAVGVTLLTRPHLIRVMLLTSCHTPHSSGCSAPHWAGGLFYG